MQARPTLEDIERQESLRTVNAVRAGIAAADMADFTAISIMLLKEVFRVAFEQIAKFILMPFAAVANIVQAALAWRQVYLHRNEGSAVAHAIIETIGALAITAAVVGGLVFSAAFVIATPALFTAVFLMKASFNIGNAIYYGVKSAKETDSVKKLEYSNKSGEAVIGAMIGVFAAITVVGVMMLGQFALAAVGIAIGVIGTLFMLGKCIHAAQQSPLLAANAAVQAEAQEQQEQERGLSQGARMMRGLGVESRATDAQSLLENDELADVDSENHTPPVTNMTPTSDSDDDLDDDIGNNKRSAFKYT